MVSTHLNNISQIGSVPQVEVKKQIWHHHLEYNSLSFFIYTVGGNPATD